MKFMEILQLKYFCSAAETENFALTARKYFVPAASVSQCIRRLEEELGCSLFDRKPNGVRLNEFGKIFYMTASSSLGMLSDVKRKLNDEEIAGNINLLVMSSRDIVSKVIKEFKSKYKKVSFHIDYDMEDNREKYDLIITDNIPLIKEYESVELLADELVLIVSKNHPLATKEKIYVKDLEHEQFITFNTKSGLYSITRRMCNQHLFYPEVSIHCDDPYYIIQYVEENLGITVVPLAAWSSYLNENVVLRKIEDATPEYAKKRSVLTYNTRKYMQKSVKIFMEMLLKECEKYK